MTKREFDIDGANELLKDKSIGEHIIDGLQQVKEKIEHPFSVKIDEEYTFELCNRDGSKIYDLKEAANAAEHQYKNQWELVSNGIETMTRLELHAPTIKELFGQ